MYYNKYGIKDELSIVAYCCKQKEKKERKRKKRKEKKKRTIEINFRGQSRTVNNINISTLSHTVVNL